MFPFDDVIMKISIFYINFDNDARIQLHLNNTISIS